MSSSNVSSKNDDSGITSRSSNDETHNGPRGPKQAAEEFLNEDFNNFGLVEVQIPTEQANVWYDAYIIAVHTIKSKENNQMTLATVIMAQDGLSPSACLSSLNHQNQLPLNMIRLKCANEPLTNLQDFEPVEVRFVDSNKFISWKLALIEKVKGESVMIKYCSGDETSIMDICSITDVRYCNTSQPFSEHFNPFYSFCLPVSKDLLPSINNDVAWLSNYDLHKDFKKILGVINVHYDKKTNSLVFLGFDVDDKKLTLQMTFKRSKMLEPFHSKKLVDNHSLHLSKLEAMKNLGLSGDGVQSNVLVHKLEVKPNYVGLAIGRNGVNIQKARAVKDIISVEWNSERGFFLIRSTTEVACHKVTQMLGYTDAHMEYDLECSKFFTDKPLIQDLLEKSGLFQIKLITPQEDPNCQKIHLEVIGLGQNIENFKILLNYQLSEWKEIEAMKAHNYKLYKQISQTRGPSHGSRFYKPYFHSDTPKNFADAVKKRTD